jgi:hypothetical protein
MTLSTIATRAFSGVALVGGHQNQCCSIKNAFRRSMVHSHVAFPGPTRGGSLRSGLKRSSQSTAISLYFVSRGLASISRDAAPQRPASLVWICGVVGRERKTRHFSTHRCKWAMVLLKSFFGRKEGEKKAELLDLAKRGSVVSVKSPPQKTRILRVISQDEPQP